MFRKMVGLIVLLIALAGIAVVWWMLAASSSLSAHIPLEWTGPRGRTFVYSWQSPPLFAVIAAISIAFAVAATFIGLELRDVNLSRRSRDPQRKPLAPWVIMSATRGIFSGEVTVTVLIPAHNEEQLIGATLDSLHTQERKPDRIIVVADNCTDQTVAIARSRGVEVRESTDNEHKKAGALNQVLTQLLPTLGPNDTVMIMDADTRLDPQYLATAVACFTNDRGLSAIGGLYSGEEGKGLLGQLQRNEYTRYTREISRRRGRVFVLTGTASIFRSGSLREVAAARGSTIPGIYGDVYDTAALTEDNELTIALKSLGGLMMSPAQCKVETELMPTLPTLWRQRLRWQRGALENIAEYGITSTTTKYWSQQLGIAYSVFALSCFFLLLTLQILATDTWVWFPFWMLMLVIFMVERVVTVWPGGWRARLLGASILPELLFDAYLDLIFVKGVLDIAFRKKPAWGDERRAEVQAHA